MMEVVGESGFLLVGSFVFKWKYLYYFLSACLALSVYFYGLQFLSERPIPAITFLGDGLYALVIVAPVLCFVMFVAVMVIEVTGTLTRSMFAMEFLSVLSAIVGIASSLWQV